MTSFLEVASKPNVLLSMTGHTLEELDALLPFFENELLESKQTLEGKERVNKPAFYKNSVFSSTSDQLFFILTYTKQYPTQTVQGQLFGISQPKANSWIQYLMPILSSALDKMNVLPSRDMQAFDEKKASLYLHDGTERIIQRPKDNAKQKEHYSGKKKAHTVKNNIIANSNCEVIFLTPTVEGKKHDKKIADESNYRLPKGSALLQDTGFQGFSPEDVLILQPAKKPKGKNLTQEQKVINRGISRIRIRVEHVVSGIKRCRIVKDKFRNWAKGFADLAMVTACGLHNLRLKFRSWETVSVKNM
jgi:hypothetical protein